MSRVSLWVCSLLVACATGQAQPAPREFREATTTEAEKPATKSDTEDLAQRFPCLAEIQRATTEHDSPRIPLAQLWHPLPRARNRPKRKSFEVEVAEGREPAPVQAPELRPPVEAIEARLPASVRKLWRELHDLPTAGSPELRRLRRSAIRWLALHPKADHSCALPLFVELEKRSRFRSPPRWKDQLDELLAARAAHPENGAIILALAYHQDVGTDAGLRWAAGIEGEWPLKDPLGWYARYVARAGSKFAASDFRELAEVETGLQAAAAWFRVARLEDDPRAKLEAIEHAQASLPPKGSSTWHDAVTRLHLRLLLPRGTPEQRLTLAAHILNLSDPSRDAREEALEQLADSLSLIPEASTESVTPEVFVDLVRVLAQRALEEGRPNEARRVLMLAKSVAPDPSAIDSELATLEEAPLPKKSDLEQRRLEALASRCRHLWRRDRVVIELQFRVPSPKITATPTDSDFGRCVVDRARHLLSDWQGSLKVTFASYFDSPERDEGNYSKVWFVIVGSAPKYENAWRILERAKRKLKLEIKDRDIAPNGEPGGFYCEREICVPRGRFDDGAYLTIEPSSLYRGFRPKTFVVVAASGGERAGPVRQTLARARRAGLPAYLKDIRVYTGCMH